MKILKGLTIFFVMGLIAASCFSPPEFSSSPEIHFDDLYLTSDSLILSITFKDGDGDLGIPSNAIDSPYNAINYFLENGDGKLYPISTGSIAFETGNAQFDTLTPSLNLPPNATGQLVSVRTRKKTPYATLPSYLNNIPCPTYYYQYDSVFIFNNAAVFDSSYHVVKTINVKEIINGQPFSRKIYVLLDTLYYEINPNHYNIQVDFLVYQPESKDADKDGFVEYDWRKQLCTTFDGKFPKLSDTNSPLEGTLRYSMNSAGFSPTNSAFGNKAVKLRIQIKDRAFHLSNIIETAPKTMQQLQRN